MYLLGFSINLLTLFGMVLAIGIVVDDAIVVLENVERIMTTEHKPPREAAIQAMQEVSGPVVAIVLVLLRRVHPGVVPRRTGRRAVPPVRRHHRRLGGDLRGRRADADAGAVRDHAQAGAWRAAGCPSAVFNRGFDWLTRPLHRGRRFFLQRAVIALVLVGGDAGRDLVLFQRVPGSLVPDEDQGYVFLVVGLPAGRRARPDASRHRSKVTEGVMKNPAVANVITFSGFDFLAGAQKTNRASRSSR